MIRPLTGVLSSIKSAPINKTLILVHYDGSYSDSSNYTKGVLTSARSSFAGV